MIRFSTAVLLCSALFAGAAAAQDDKATLFIELNRITDTSEGACQVVFFGRNGLQQPIDEVTLRLAVFDASGVFQNLLALPLGKLGENKRRVVQYNLPTACSDISEIIVNDVAKCQIGGASEDSEVCLNQLTVASRTEIDLGL